MSNELARQEMYEMTVTLRLELQVRDYDMWRHAFEQDAGGRAQAGMRCYRIYRPADDDKCVLIDSEFDAADRAEAFLDIMRTKVWPDPEKAPAKVGIPKTRIIELVEAKNY